MGNNGSYVMSTLPRGGENIKRRGRKNSRSCVLCWHGVTELAKSNGPVSGSSERDTPTQAAQQRSKREVDACDDEWAYRHPDGHCPKARSPQHFD
jgi:hypothetical protein